MIENSHTARSLSHGVNDLPLKLALFVVWPFGAFLHSLFKNPASRSSYCIYWGVGLLFCWSMYYSPSNTFYIDLILTVEHFYETHLTFEQLLEEIKKTLTMSVGAHPDFYRLIIYWLTGNISTNFHLMYVIAGIPTLYCMLNSLKYIIEDKNFKATVYGYILMLLFVLPRSIFHVQNFRYFTAFWICVYCSLCYFRTRSKKYLFGFGVLPFIHYSFLLLLFCLFLFFFLKKYPRFSKCLFYVSIPFALIPFDFLLQSFVSLDIYPLLFNDKIGLYLSDDMNDKLGIYANGLRSLFKAINVIILVFTTLYMLNRVEKQKTHSYLYSLFYFSMICLSVFGFINVIPVLGERFFLLSRTLCIFLWFKLVFPKHKKFLFVFLLGSALDIYTDAGLYMKVLSPDFFYSNMVSLIVKNIDISFYN
ncbi:EpsG family protein [Parabacteroides sp. ZJ-118]|uniref:EpsG family protein n=1 Tax=Parabacteroides sp. ZJ-118 TaxID=2709398 RepID=UPI0013EDA645|nr:EpsG family protein [Parabacteroides sp. ZJ-118]